ncbi:Lrp/AsnC family transcriptional regulator [Flexivirga oryzae]|uniref:DNA-binding Lrp family transcriptional regulator n=1 Tax=Flexivirga oryzae TaxID=1794944 RepID=A0A839NBC3_9MICO|nr:Lrp/AsnC family transcriptional regulator [Flexivirga oryzae]MBB2893274.1 DNA-binding Lrp family transcriptional regulator [Flexivirga oryzae]
MTPQESSKPGRSPSSTGQSAAPRALDAVDLRIVGALERDARLSVRSLAEQLHLSRAATYARLQRLLDDGVIAGFSARVVPHLAGLQTTAYIALQIEQNTWRAVSAELAKLDYIDSISLLASEFDVLALAHAPDNQALRTLVLERIQAIPGVLGTRTWLAFEEIRGAGAPWER